MQWYDRQLDRLSMPVMARQVSTSFGTTHMLMAGPEDTRALIVLHGMNMNAAAMIGAIRELSVVRRVVAIDIIGMPGKSAGMRPARKGDGYPRWLGEVMDIVGITRADLLGESFGGWLSLKSAALWPERVKSVVLLDSGGIVPFTVRGQVVAGLAALRHILERSARSRLKAAKPFYGPDISVDPHFAELLGLTLQHTRMDIDLRGLPVLGRAQLKSFQAPVFVSYGEYDVFFNVHRATRRAKQIFAGPVLTEVVERQGHRHSEAATQARYERVRNFLDSVATG